MINFPVMMDWLKDHAFLATWLGPIVGIIGLILQQTRSKGAFDFRAFTIYLTFFLLLGYKLTPGVDASKLGVDLVFALCFFAILWDNGGSNILSRRSLPPVDNSGSPPSDKPSSTD